MHNGPVSSIKSMVPFFKQTAAARGQPPAGEVNSSDWSGCTVLVLTGDTDPVSKELHQRSLCCAPCRCQLTKTLNYFRHQHALQARDAVARCRSRGRGGGESSLVARCGSRGRCGLRSADRRQQPGCIYCACVWRAHGDALHGATPMCCAFRVAARRDDFAHAERSPAQRCTHAVCVNPAGAPPAVNADAARLGSARCRVRNLRDA
jgi:hypothetical protein